MHRRSLLAGAAGITASLALTDGAASADTSTASGLPEILDLPAGWQPEGIAIAGRHFYAGSLVDGAIYRGSLFTGEGRVLAAGREGGQAVGLEFDHHGRLWVCSGNAGGAVVHDAATGKVLATYSFGGTFVNDAVATARGVWFTDSYRPVLYFAPFDRFGRLPAQSAVRTVALTGDLAEEGAFNNGIEEAADGRLIIGQMLADRLVAYQPRTGASTRIDLGGASVLRADGLLRRGRYLYVVRNFLNVIAKFRLSADLSTAKLVEEITHPQFAIPATIARFGPYLYAVNARFDVPEPGPETTYNVVRVQG